jgi:hypothetical protein
MGRAHPSLLSPEAHPSGGHDSGRVFRDDCDLAAGNSATHVSQVSVSDPPRAMRERLTRGTGGTAPGDVTGPMDAG